LCPVYPRAEVAMPEDRAARQVPVQERARATREAIVRAYVEAAERARSADVSLDEVRRLALTSMATTYRYFRSREDVQREVFFEYMERLRTVGAEVIASRAETVAPRVPFERLNEILRGDHSSHRGLIIISRACLIRSADARASLHGCSDEIGARIAGAISPAKFAPPDLLSAVKVATRMYLLWHLFDAPSATLLGGIPAEVRGAVPSELSEREVLDLCERAVAR